MKKRKNYNKKLIANTLMGFMLLIFALTIPFISNQNNHLGTNNAKSNETPAESLKEPRIVTDIANASDFGYEIELFYENEKIRKQLIDFNAQYPFYIKVNRSQNVVVVYGIDKHGKYTIPYKVFVCSTGKVAQYTPLGTFKMSGKYRWCQMVDYTFSQYAIRIHGQIMLHSIPYETMSNNTLEYAEYNKLGKPASLGCIRFQVSDIKWIYEHCPIGTKVEIYDRQNETFKIPLPTIQKISKNDKRRNWDPTDPDENNPWNE